MNPKPYKVTLRVHVAKDWVFGALVIGIVVQALGKYIIIGYLDPSGKYRSYNATRGALDSVGPVQARAC